MTIECEKNGANYRCACDKCMPPKTSAVPGFLAPDGKTYCCRFHYLGGSWNGEMRCHCRCLLKGPLVSCVVCGLRKPPLGRSVAAEAANGMCSPQCEGYAQWPCPGELWTNEETNQPKGDT